MLAEECGKVVSLQTVLIKFLQERKIVAALKLSEGDLTKLRRAVEVAKEDWRDLLVAAGFGHDTRAHEQWLPTSGQLNPP